MDKLLTNKYVWIGLGVIVLIVLLYLAFRNKTIQPPPPTPLPSQTDWGSNLDNTQSQIIRNYAVDLHNDLKGLNWTGWDSALYKDLLTQNDTILTGVYNDFNQLYAMEEGGTLTEWIKNEGGYNDPFTPYLTQLADRLDGLNLN